MRKLASIQRITNLEKIDGKDFIELASIQGWKVIVQKGEFNIRDLVIYIEYDTIIPDKPPFSSMDFLRKRCYKPGYNGFRIRNMKMGNVFSQGIVFNTSILKSRTVYSGMNLTRTLGITRYAPEEQQEQIKTRYNWFIKFIRKLFKIKKKRQVCKYPTDIPKSNEENIQNIFDDLDKNNTYIVTEKLEGQAVTYEFRHKKGLGNKDIFNVYSHNLRRPKEDMSNWWKIAKKLDLKFKMSLFPQDMMIQGEIVGPGIQKNIYALEELDFYVYGAKSLSTGITLGHTGLESLCGTMFLNYVPILLCNVKLMDSVEKMLELSNGQSYINPAQIREGMVWKTDNFKANNTPIHFKVKSPKYLQWLDKKEGKCI